MISHGVTKTENIQADIVVIGGGASGLCAAVSAAEAGVKDIIVLEKAKITGGNGRASVGFFAAESAPQQRLGIDISRDEMFTRFMEFNHWQSDPRLIRAWINKTAEFVSWLEGKGLKTIPGEAPFYKGKDSARWHMLWQGEGKSPGMVGKAVVETLTGDCQKLGVRLFLGTSASRILTDKKQKVTGVMATAKDKELGIVAKSAIVATGGFARNKKLLKKYFPLYNENMFTHSLPQMTGVNKKGERYIGEFTNGSFDSSNALTRQPESISYTVFDEKIKQDIIRRREPSGPNTEALAAAENWPDIIENDIKKEVDNGRIMISDSWDEIARFIGAKPEVLKATVEQYNSFCDNGYDADFLKDKQYLWPLRTPPYYTIISTQGFDVTSGGIKINHRTEVLNEQGDSIGGLYAVGNDAGCVHGSTYTGGVGAPGCDLSFAFCSGFIAGGNAAKYVLASQKRKEV